jgi:hypothetical protein
VNEFNAHLETLSEHHDIPKVRWRGAAWLEAVPDESYAGWSWLMLVRPTVLWACLRGRNWDRNAPGMVYPLQISIVIYLFAHGKDCDPVTNPCFLRSIILCRPTRDTTWRPPRSLKRKGTYVLHLTPFILPTAGNRCLFIRSSANSLISGARQKVWTLQWSE